MLKDSIEALHQNRYPLVESLARVCRNLPSFNAGNDVVGSTCDRIPQFSGLHFDLLGRYAVHHQKTGQGDAGHHGNDSR